MQNGKFEAHAICLEEAALEEISIQEIPLREEEEGDIILCQCVF